jgi:hypothetical protein
MNIETINHKDNNIPSMNKKTLDLDPTKNDILYLDLWNRIKEKVEKEMEKPTMDSEPPEEFMESEPHHMISNERKFGRSMRRLVKLVCRAFLNPSKQNNMNDPTPN